MAPTGPPGLAVSSASSWPRLTVFHSERWRAEISPNTQLRDDSHSVRALLASRALLVKIKRDLENQIRGLLKNVGLVIGRAKFNVFTTRAEELIEDRPELIAVVGPLLKARKAIEQQTDDLDRKVLKLALMMRRSEGS